MINVTIMTVGDEICIGQITNTNAAWIASKCTSLGVSVIKHVSVPDNKEAMINCLNDLYKESDFILITGGLGPTHDDITKDVLAEYFEDKMVLHEQTFEILKSTYKKRGTEFLERNKRLAYLPSKCKVLPNNVGAAPGMLFEKENKIFISMPGVPLEMKDIMNNHVLSLIKSEIKKRRSDIVLYKTLNTIGIPESHLADLLGNPADFLSGGSLAFLPSYRGVKLRIGCTSYSIDEAKGKINDIENYIKRRAGRYIFSSEDEKINETIGKLLREKRMTVSVAESCTGGMLGAAFTDIPGSSDYFTGGVIVYSNEAKIKTLGVPQKTINDFGAVSKETAEALALNVRNKFNTDFGIGITGIAGPGGGTDDKPVGTVWIGLSDKYQTEAKKFVFGEDRTINRELFVGRALGLLFNRLKEIK